MTAMWPHRWTRVCAVALFLGTLLAAPPAVAADPAVRSANPAGTHIRSPQTFYAYVAAGENLDVSFVKFSDQSGSPVQDLTVTVRGPGTAPLTCQVFDVQPTGSGCAWGNLTSSTPGIWSVELTMSFCPSSGICGRDRFDWDVTVERGPTPVPGRVWSERYGVNQVASGPSADLTFWYQSEFGYTYRATYRDYHGIDSTIEADNFGVLQTGTCTPAYQSSYSLKPAGGACGGVFKVFFEEPAADLPATATRWDGAGDWIKSPVLADPAITNGTFTATAPGSRAGTLSFDLARYSGSLTVRVDVNDDGDSTDPVDRWLVVNASEGTVTVPFDGLDGLGQPVPPGQSMSFEVVVDKVAEIHFVNGDVELRGGGIEVTRLNGPPSGTKILYWNDTAFANPDPDRCSSTPVTDGRAGVDSTGGVHGWDLGSCGSVGGANANDNVNGGWGDVRSIDDWTYVPVTVTHVVKAPGHGIRITKTASTPTARPGDVVNYTITVENTGDFVHTLTDPAELTDNLSAVLDDATMIGSPVASAGVASFTTPVITWSGPLAPGATATITYSVQVNQPDTGDKKLTNAVTSDTPGANCTTGGVDAACTTVVRVPSLRIEKTADRTEFKPGDVVTFTITATNEGEVPFGATDPASWTDDLTDVLDDAVFDVDDVTTTGGTVGFTSPVLSWSGPLAVGQSAVVTYPVTVADPDTGNGKLVNSVTGPPGAAINCVVCEVELLSRLVSLRKDVVSRTPNPDGSTTIVYDITVDGAGSAPSTYDLTDRLLFGAGVAVATASVSGASVNVGWDGTAQTTVAAGMTIGPGESHVYRVTVNATPGSATTGAATDCTLDGGETGTGFLNSATVTGNGGEHSADACEPIPRITITKVVRPGSPTPNGDGTYTIVYQIDVANEGTTTVSYDLVDLLTYGSGHSIATAGVQNVAPGSVPVDPDWDGQVVTTIATGVDIDRGETHTYVVTVTSEVDPATPGTATDCDLTTGESGTGFLATATLDSDGQLQHADACVAAPNVVITKKTAGDPVADGDGRFTQAYDITVTNNGAGATTYDLDDQLRFGDGVAVESAAVVNTAPGTVAMSPSWDGVADVVVAEAVAVEGGATHAYRVTVVAKPDPDVTTGAAADCVLDTGEAGTGFRNTATMTQNGRSLLADACTAPPALAISKKVTGNVQNGDGTHTITYEIEVSNGGAGTGTYDLTDSLAYGAEVFVAGASATGPAPDTGWNGDNDPFLAAGVVIAGNTRHAYVVTVTVIPPFGALPGALDCVMDSGEQGTGAWNSTTMISNGVAAVATACTGFPDLKITKAIRPGSPLPNGDGTFTVEYEIEVTNRGAEATTYDLTDELAHGAAIGVVSAGVRNTEITTNPAWNGSSDRAVAAGVDIPAGASHTYLVTVGYAVDVASSTSATTDCVLDAGETGTGFLGRAVATTNGVDRKAQACAEPPALSITKAMTGPATANGDGSYAVSYDITVTNSGAGAGVYSLTDRFRFGAGIEVGPVTASAVDAGPAPNGGWTPTGDAPLAAGVTIAGASTHTFRITASAEPGAAATGTATDCVVDPGESGTGLRNVAVLTSNGRSQEVVACGEVAAVTVAKELLGATPQGDGMYRIDYGITVTNAGAAATTYDLKDTPEYGHGVTVVSAWAGSTPAWNGTTNQVIAANLPLAAGAEHVHLVTVVANAPVGAAPAALDCALADGEHGTGALNTAALTVNGVTSTANACSPFPSLTVTKVVLPGSPRVEPDGGVVVDYRITVANTGVTEAEYDLDDRLRSGAGVTVERAVVRMSPDAAPTNPGWNGASDLRVAGGVHLAAGASHVFHVTTEVALNTDLAATDVCGLGNEAIVTVNGMTLSTDTCAPAPGAGLAATGADVYRLAGAGLALIVIGGALVLAARRRPARR